MRNDNCRWLITLVAPLELLLGHAISFAVEPDTRPNILIVLSDDHSAPNLGCYGDYSANTPKLDRFAKQGIIFEKHFCVAPQCVPSRAGLMTGRSAIAAQMTRFSSPLPENIPTLPELLRSEGYFTGICRRCFHLDGPPIPNPIVKDVFERHPQLKTFGRRVDFLDVSEPRTQTVPIVEKFFSEVPAGKPFFLWVSLDEPHHPWDVPAPVNSTDPTKIVVPPYLPDIPEVRADLARYKDEIAAADEEFQWIMDILDKHGLAENTLVVFLGDNGYAFPHGKGSLYDPGLNTPLIVRWPGRIQPNSKSAELISGEDLTPTLLEAAGAAVPSAMTGKSFLKCLTQQDSTPRKFIFAERGPHGGFGQHTMADGFDLSRCVRSQRYKLIYNCTPNQKYRPIDSTNEDCWKQIVKLHEEGRLAKALDRAYFASPRPVFELYDLEKDPGELNNVAERPEYADVQHELNAALQEKVILDYDYLPLPAMK